MTDGNSPILTTGTIGAHGDEGRIYRVMLDLTTFTEIATGITFSSDPIFPCRNRLVTMTQKDNKLYIATGYGPIRIWNGTTFISEAGLNAPLLAPTVTAANVAVNDPFVVNTSFTNVVAQSHFAVIKGHENELYCASAGIGMTEFVMYDRATGGRTSLGALPAIAPANRYWLVGHNDGATITYVIFNVPTNEFNFYRYTRTSSTQGTWTTTPVLLTAVNTARELNAVLYNPTSKTIVSAIVPRLNDNSIFITMQNEYSTINASAYDLFVVSQNSDYAQQNIVIFGYGLYTPTGQNYRGLVTATDRSGDTKLYLVYNEGNNVQLNTFDWSTSVVVNPVPQTITGYQLTADDVLLHVGGSNESRIRLIKGGVGFTLAHSLWKDITSPSVGTWSSNGGTYSANRMSAPIVAPGGKFSGNEGQEDFAVYGRLGTTADLVKNFFVMQPVSTVSETVMRKYKYGYTYANDSTESALSPESVEIEVVSGRPIRMDFTIGPQAATLYRRLYRTDDYYGVGSAPPVSKQLMADRSNPVVGNRFQVNDNVSTWFIDDSDGPQQASVRPTQSELNPAASLTSTSPPPHNASIISDSGNRLFLAGFPLNSAVPTNPSMIAFSTEEDYETFDPVGGINNRDRSDGDSITAMVPLDQDSLAIYKVNSIHVKHGDPTYPGAFRRVSDTIGCIAPRSAASAGRIHCFLSKLGVYDFDGSTARAMSEPINLDCERNLTDVQKMIAAGAFYDNKYHLAIVDPTISTTKNSIIYVWDFPLQAWSARNVAEARLFADVRGTIKRLLFAPYNEGATAGRIMRWNSGQYLSAVACRVETGFFDMGNAYLDKIWRRLWFHLNIPVGLVVTVSWSVDDGRAIGNLDPITGTGRKEPYLIQCTRAMMGKNLKFVINYNGIGMFEMYGIDGQAIVLPRRRGITPTTEVAKSITITSPTSGTSWANGSTQNITWTSTGTIANVRIEVSTNNGVSWTDIIASTANDGTHSWTIATGASAQALIRITEIGGSTSATTPSFNITATTFTLDMSSSFPIGGSIPSNFCVDAAQGGNGNNFCPALAWSNAPVGTVEYAVFMDDAQGGPFTHWSVTGIGSGTTSISSSYRAGSQGLANWSNSYIPATNGYDGPINSGSTTHNYTFTVYALGAAVDFSSAPNAFPGPITRINFEAKMAGNILAQASYLGTAPGPA